MGSFRLRWSTLYEWAVGVFGLLVALYYLPQLFHHSLPITLFLFILATLLEVFPVPLGKANSSLLIALPVAVSLSYGLAESVWIMVVAELLFPTILRHTMKKSVRVFNAGQYALSAWITGKILEWVVSGHSVALTNWQTYLDVLLGFACFIVVNHGLIHILQGIRHQFDASDVFQMLMGEGINVLISLPFSLLLIAIAPEYPLAAPIVLLPIILLAQTLGLYQRNKTMQGIYRATAQLTSEFDTKQIAESVAEIAAKITYADSVVVLVEQPGTRGTVFLPAAIHTASDKETPRLREVQLGEGILGRALESNTETYLPDLRRDLQKELAEWTGSYLSLGTVPMTTRHRLVGAIVCLSRHAYAFGELFTQTKILANQVAVLIENAHLYQSLQEQSWRDGATGLYNYRYFYESLAQHVKQAALRNQVVSVMVIDVDYFKKFNDTYGHLAGDKVLSSLAELMTGIVGPSAIVARYGGEEFGLIVPLDAESTYQMAEEIRNAVSRHVVEFEGYQLQGITVSIGVASYPNHAQSDRDLLLKADSAMYWGSKQRGRNHTAMYTPEFDVQLFVDELTGLFTYHFLNLRVREEISQGVWNWGVISLNVDHFSRVNESFSFTVGDRVLRELSLVLKECIRHSELACRYGGDEFLILVPSAQQVELNTIANRVTRTVTGHRFQVNPNVTISLRVRAAARVYVEIQDATSLFDQIGRLFLTLHHVDESLA